MSLRILLVVGLLSLISQPSPAMERGAVSAAYAGLVPQTLLSLAHTPEVWQELQLTPRQTASLEQLFAQIDGPWFRSRLLPPDKQRPIIEAAEQQLHDWLQQNATEPQRRRLAQLELRAQNLRCLLRDDVARQLKLQPAGQEQLAELARTTDAAQQKHHAAKMRGEAVEDLEAAAQKAVKEEQASLAQITTPAQRQQLGQLLGESFNTTQLARIYPMAPEFVPVDQWINSEPLILEQLRGKVVLVHFYAFQCHNCHANFEIYKRWHQELKNKGVVVVGIQTPETARERDPAAVRAAASERELLFPILHDQKSENWQAWGNTMWPTVYVVDKRGYIRQWWQGELNWKGATGDKTIETVVDRLLQE
ncbi:redoxin domain-containing protein [Lignipirellula cremea]|uniref:Thiol-disulfide oxidoreductase YkuV n=1 Tax=Lignipirellula cremea TaxID=2528010 RepID=A0A518E3J4_9BACT|nr:redoxin domain-containing protein [Lignipirellula cremea]QDU98659.1 Thiol-disulfide oxidoreductase YkuV [Lignipirellula cremea]